MPQTIQVTVYSFDELADSAKETARAWFRDGQLGYDWYDSVYDDANQIAKILGIEFDERLGRTMSGTQTRSPKIFFSGFSSQGDGACFEGRYEYAKGAPKKIREYAPKDIELHRIADELQELQRKHFYRLDAIVKHRGHYYHSLCTEIDVTDSQTGNDTDSETVESVKELLRDFMTWIYRALERESEWLQANEQVDESIRANEYRFDESGNIA